MSAQQEFIRYMAVVGGSIALFFAAQQGMASGLDVRWHEQLNARPANAKIVSIREAESAALSKAKIEKAMATVARGRTADKRIAPKPSSDLSAMSGWVQDPNFAPYEPKVVPAAASTTTAGQ